jgi:predicted AAA+ superfamily ATPase
MTDFNFPSTFLPAAFINDLGRQNPWWTGAPSLPPLPFHRWPFQKLLDRLDKPLAPALVIRGPRQIGKSTLQNQLIQRLLKDGVRPNRILRVQFDDLPSLAKIAENDEPILRVADWFERSVLKEHFNAAAARNEPAFLFFDEVQNLRDWDVQLKSLVDHAKVRVLVTGSSALRIGKGRDSLAGRIQMIEVGPFRLSEIASVTKIGQLKPFQTDNGLADWNRTDFWHGLIDSAKSQANVLVPTFSSFSERGGYPLAQDREIPWPEVADQLNETVIRRVIGHDLRLGERGRKRDPKLLEEMFRMACRYVGQCPGPALLAKEANQQLNASVGVQRVNHYLDFLDQTLLIRSIQPLEIRLKKRKGFAKLVLCDHALRAAWLQEIVPLDPVALETAEESLVTLAGRIAESVLGYYFASLNAPDVAHVPGKTDVDEIDYVLTVGDHRIPVEVKYRRRLSGKDFAGLAGFLDQRANSAPLGLMVTRDFGYQSLDPRVICVPLQAMLMIR